ncbi:MAG: hypothetical protein PHZ04_02060 [Patescibacteria group bacterium]|nr:hypothetical protein [Patescibacteria group bacterium]MDD5294450.1 hypothetical protein [Patescibacteria group bacterium]MDD5554994.1 hypothetical protein [Patescibacteria group bacterium]
MKTIVSRRLSVHQEHEFLQKLESAGLIGNLAQRVIESKGNDLAVKVVSLVQSGKLVPTASQSIARAIMGNNFFGVEEAIKHFRVNPTNQQLAALYEIPFPEAVLRELKDTHILVAVFPLSILEIRNRVGSKLFCKRFKSNNESFMREHGELSWQLVCKTVNYNLIWKSWEEQLELLDEDDEVPTAQVMVYTILGRYLATGECLCERYFHRTSTIDFESYSSDVRRVTVHFHPHPYEGIADSDPGLSLETWGDSGGSNEVISSARKVPVARIRLER